jgi:hypothetical protein
MCWYYKCSLFSHLCLGAETVLPLRRVVAINDYKEWDFILRQMKFVWTALTFKLPPRVQLHSYQLQVRNVRR